MTAEALKVQNLTIKLKINHQLYPIVRDVSFCLKKGSTLAIVGESGCGKTMLALAIMGILPQPPAILPEGEILYEGQNLLALKSSQMRATRWKKIAMIFQDPLTALNPVFTIGEQLMEVARTHMGLSHEMGLALILKTLEDVHLPKPKEILKTYPHQLSGGMLQRAVIAMALICSPDILIADEPTTALDVTIQAQILSLLKELQNKKGMATLLITHDMGVVAENADDVLVLYGGEAIEQAPVLTLFDRPAHPYTQALFSSIPNTQSGEKKLSAIPGFVPRMTQLPTGCAFHPRCSFAMDLCKTEKVPFFQLNQVGHRTKCWLFQDYGQIHDAAT